MMELQLRHGDKQFSLHHRRLIRRFCRKLGGQTVSPALRVRFDLNQDWVRAQLTRFAPSVDHSLGELPWRSELRNTLLTAWGMVLVILLT
jgi:hypothetical protein